MSWTAGADGRPMHLAKLPDRLVDKGFRADLVVGGLWLSGSMEAVSTVAMIEVEDLVPAGVLARIADAERRDREVQLEKLRLAYQWCVQHPATADSGAATWGDAGLPGLGDCDASLGGDGTPGVAASWRRSSVLRWG